MKVPLIGSTVVPLSEEQTGVKGAFEVRTERGSVLLAADSPLETDDWIMCLKQAKVPRLRFHTTHTQLTMDTGYCGGAD